MGRFMARRLLFFGLTLLITSVLVFILTRVLPGDVARVILGREASAEAVAAKRAELGLDRPLIVQYADWAANFVTGDWGQEFSGAREEIRPLVKTILSATGTPSSAGAPEETPTARSPSSSCPSRTYSVDSPAA